MYLHTMHILILMLSLDLVRSFVSSSDYPTATKDLAAVLDKPRTQKCTYSKAHGMSGADCSGRDLNQLPKNLRTNIEILDASYNRIRRIDEIATYSKLRYVYLGDNFILNLEPGTVDKLSHLEVLDLSVNSMQSVPSFLFEIETLRRLYLSNNSFQHDLLEKVKFPIKAPLEYVNLAYCNMVKMPYFNVMPDLYHLNISGNNFERITVDDLTPLCRLKVLDVTSIGRNHISDCDCLKLQAYIMEKQITVLPELRHICNYSQFELFKCSESYLNDTDLTLHNKCLESIRVREEHHQTRVTWAAVAISITSFLILFIFVLYVIHVFNVRSMKLEEKKQKHSDVNHTLMKK